METNPTTSNQVEPERKHPAPTKPQLWLLLGAILIGVTCELWMEQDDYVLYSYFWLVALAVFVAFNFKRVVTNRTVLELIVPTLVICVVLILDYMNHALLDFTMLTIPALMMTIGVFTTQEIAYKREGKAVVGVLSALFLKTFSAIGAYFRAYAGVFHTKGRTGARHGWIGLVIGLPLMAIVLALLASADAGTARLLGGLFDRFNIWEWSWRIIVVFGTSMLFYSLFFNLIWGKRDADLAPVKQDWALAGPGVVIGLLLLAYALFTYVQFGYLFGGVLPVELTYSEYAREGFGQFLAVTIINFTVLGISLAKSEPKRAIRVFQVLLLAASMIVLASACWRMLLYVGAYGLTIRRVQTLWLMAYFVFLAVVGIVRIFRERTPFLRIGAFALVYWYAAFLSVNWNTLMCAYNASH